MGLRVTLIILALYTGLLGLLFLLAPGPGAAVLDISVPDPVAFRQWGAALLLLALVAVLLAIDPLRYPRLLWVPLLGLPLDSLVLAYELVIGTSGLRQLGGPLTINLVLFALLVLFYPRRPAASSAESSVPRGGERLGAPPETPFSRY